MDIDINSLNSIDNRLDCLKQSIENIVLHNKLSIVLDDPNYGVDLMNSIGTSINVFTINMLKQKIQTSISIYEPRVKDVQVLLKKEH